MDKLAKGLDELEAKLAELGKIFDMYRLELEETSKKQAIIFEVFLKEAFKIAELENWKLEAADFTKTATNVNKGLFSCLDNAFGGRLSADAQFEGVYVRSSVTGNETLIRVGLDFADHIRRMLQKSFDQVFQPCPIVMRHGIETSSKGFN